MSRKYVKMKELEPQILAMRAAGKTRKEIAKSLGLETEQIKKWFRRYQKKEQNRSRCKH